MTARLKKFIKRYRFFLLLAFINGLLFIIKPELSREIAALSVRNLLEMLSIIPPIFLLLGLLDVWVPREMMMAYMGKGTGIKGGVLAFVLGSFSAGPLYAAFPVAAVFLKKGVSLTNVFLFIGAWSTTKIPMMLFETTQLGGRFALIRLGLNLIAITLLAMIMERTTTEEDSEAIYERASRQTDET